MILVDTSVWIEFFRVRNPIDLARYADIDEVVTCLPVVQEVLQGFRDERAFLHVREAMLALPIVESPLNQDVYLEAAALYRAARRAGVTVRSSVDCLIAACALRHQLEVLHHGRDFQAIAKVAPLLQRSISQRSIR